MRTFFPFFLLSTLISSGCVLGYTHDATNAQKLGQVSVYAFGSTCSGEKCLSPEVAATSTDNTGLFIFDPYTEPGTYVRPAPGNEAMLMYFAKAGYRTNVHHFSPKLVEAEENGKKYSPVPSQYLTPIGQVLDSDGDGLTDVEETRLGTNMLNADTDGDGLDDFVEVHGGNMVDLPSLGADPLVRDIFVEMDWVRYMTHPDMWWTTLDGPFPEAIDDVVAAFAAEGINLHLTVDERVMTAGADALGCDPNGGEMFEDFDAIKDSHFNPDRQPFFHYALFTASYCKWEVTNEGDPPEPVLTTSSGLSRTTPATDFFVSMRAKFAASPNPLDYPGGEAGVEYQAAYATWRAKVRLQQGGTIMHELGHNLGLNHGGGHDGQFYRRPANNPVYLSVMSYSYQLKGVRRDGVSVLDYSQFPLQPLFEDNLTEWMGLETSNNTPAEEIARYTVVAVDGSKWLDASYAAACNNPAIGTNATRIDWNLDCTTNFAGVSADIGNDGIVGQDYDNSKEDVAVPDGPIRVWRDWDNLDFGGGGVIGVSFSPSGVGSNRGSFSSGATDEDSAPGQHSYIEAMSRAVRPRPAPAGSSAREWQESLDRLGPGQRRWIEYTTDSPIPLSAKFDTECE